MRDAFLLLISVLSKPSYPGATNKLRVLGFSVPFPEIHHSGNAVGTAERSEGEEAKHLGYETCRHGGVSAGTLRVPGRGCSRGGASPLRDCTAASLPSPPAGVRTRRGGPNPALPSPWRRRRRR